MDCIKSILRRLNESYTSMDYKRATDEELVELGKNNDKKASNELILRYEKLVKYIAKNSGLYVQGGSIDDIAQEGLLGVWEAIKSFDAKKNKNFQQFAMNVAKRRMTDAVRSSTKKANSPLNYAKDIGELETRSGGGSKESGGSVKSAYRAPKYYKAGPESSYIDKEDYNKLKSFMKTGLTELEQKVLTLYLQGYNYEEIGKMIGRNRKSADNAMNMVRSKLRSKGYRGKLTDSKIIFLIESILVESDRYVVNTDMISLVESLIKTL